MGYIEDKRMFDYQGIVVKHFKIKKNSFNFEMKIKTKCLWTNYISYTTIVCENEFALNSYKKGCLLEILNSQYRK